MPVFICIEDLRLLAQALQTIHKELDISMAFTGHARIDEVGPEILVPGTWNPRATLDPGSDQKLELE